MSVVELMLLLLVMMAVLTVPSYGKKARPQRGGSETDYCKMYDSLVYDPVMNNLEREVLSRLITREDTVLEVGCRTGRVTGWLDADSVGVDDSKEMVAVARTKYPDKTFMVRDVMQRGTFRPDTFTHVLCLSDRVYCFSEKLLLFQHCFYWLKAKGRLVVQTGRAKLKVAKREKCYPESKEKIRGLAEMAGFSLAESSGPFLVFTKNAF